jgi:hypothetical protein
MDRISALRNVEEALAEFEDGDRSLPALEREVRGILRTYATEFAGDQRLYRATGDPEAAGLVVLAPSPAVARDRVADLLDEDVRVEVEPVQE